MATSKYNGNRFIVAKKLVPVEVIEKIKPTVTKAFVAYEAGKRALVIRLLHYTEEFPYAGDFSKAVRASTCRACGEQINRYSRVFVLYYNFKGYNNTTLDANSSETTCYMHLKCVIDGYQEPDIAFA